MPITSSAKKALRQNKKRAKINRSYKNKIKDLTGKIEQLTDNKKVKEAKETLPALYKALDKAVKKGVIKKNAASRKKAKAAKLINQAK